jgi:predicted phosphoribosyltransferase
VAPQTLAQPEHLLAGLDFRQAFRASNAQRVRPLLERYDIWMPYDHHQAVYAAKAVPVTIVDQGHMTGSWAFAALRRHLISVLGTLPQAAAIAGPEEQRE